MSEGEKREREKGRGECKRESREAPPRSLRVFLMLFQPGLHTHKHTHMHTEIQRSRAKDFHREGRNFYPLSAEERSKSTEREVDIGVYY